MEIYLNKKQELSSVRTHQSLERRTPEQVYFTSRSIKELAA